MALLRLAERGCAKVRRPPVCGSAETPWLGPLASVRGLVAVPQLSSLSFAPALRSCAHAQLLRMSALDKALLLEDTQAPVTLAALASLSPAQLALASLRPDLHALVRQRAHIDFLERRTRYRSSSQRDSQNERASRSLRPPSPPRDPLTSHLPPATALFDTSLDFALPDSLLDLTTAQFVLVQFNPNCKSPQVIEEAARLFLQRASQAQDEHKASSPAPRPHELSVQRCRLVRQGMSREAAGRLALEVTDEALAVKKGGAVLVQVLAKDITTFKCASSSRSSDSRGPAADLPLARPQT